MIIVTKFTILLKKTKQPQCFGGMLTTLHGGCLYELKCTYKYFIMCT